MSQQLAVPRTGEAIRCRYCGAPLRVGPDTAVAVCPYCGKPNWLRGSGRVEAARPLEPEKVEEGFHRFAGRDPDLRRLRGLELARVETVFIPFYEARGRLSAEYDYRGYVVKTRTRKQGDRYVTETYRVPFHVHGTYSTGFHALTSGKRVLGEEAADMLASHYLRSRPELVAMEDIAWRRGAYTALAADYEPGEARARVVDDACDWLRGLVDREARRRAAASKGGGAVEVTSRMIRCSVEEVNVEGPIMLPLAKVFYAVQGKLYRAFFAGWDMKPLLREEPLTPMQRAVLAVLGGAAAGAGGAAAVWGLAGPGDPLIGAAAAAIGAVVGFLASRLALKESRREEGGPGAWIRSLGEEVGETVERLRASDLIEFTGV